MCPQPWLTPAPAPRPGRVLLDAEIASRRPPSADTVPAPRASVAERRFALAPEGPAFKAAAMQLQRMREVMKQRSSGSTDDGPPSSVAAAEALVAPPPDVPPVRAKPEAAAEGGEPSTASDAPVPSPGPRDVAAASSTRS